MGEKPAHTHLEAVVRGEATNQYAVLSVENLRKIWGVGELGDISWYGNRRETKTSIPVLLESLGMGQIEWHQDKV